MNAIDIKSLIPKLKEFKEYYPIYGTITTIIDFNRRYGLDLTWDEFKKLERLLKEVENKLERLLKEESEA